MRYRIRHWEKYQHYKDRNPPWIKLYARELKTNHSWMTMDHAIRGLWCLLLCLASEREGAIPNPRQLKARLDSESDREQPLPDYGPLLQGRWIEEFESAEAAESPAGAPRVAPVAPSPVAPSARPGVPMCPECGAPLKRQAARPSPGGTVFPPAWWCATHKGDFLLDDPRILSTLTFPAQQTVHLELKAYRESLPKPEQKRSRRPRSGAFDQGLEHVDAPTDWNPPRAEKGSPPDLALSDFLKAIRARNEIHEHSFVTWFAVLIPVSLTEGNTRLTVAWPSRKGQGWFSMNYIELCRTVAASIGITRFELWQPTDAPNQ